jgi:hypothetical protein
MAFETTVVEDQYQIRYNAQQAGDFLGLEAAGFGNHVQRCLRHMRRDIQTRAMRHRWGMQQAIARAPWSDYPPSRH